jgi:hypothetical protein
MFSLLGSTDGTAYCVALGKVAEAEKREKSQSGDVEV